LKKWREIEIGLSFAWKIIHRVQNLGETEREEDADPDPEWLSKWKQIPAEAEMEEKLMKRRGEKQSAILSESGI
jgi:hypothetical protein